MTLGRIEGFNKILESDPHTFAQRILRQDSSTPKEKVELIKSIIRDVLTELENLGKSPDKIPHKEIEMAQAFLKKLQKIEDEIELDERVTTKPLQRGIDALKKRIEDVAQSTLPSFPSAPPPPSTPQLSQPHPPSTPKPSSPHPEPQTKSTPPFGPSAEKSATKPPPIRKSTRNSSTLCKKTGYF